jgi:hypothetical protein
VLSSSLSSMLIGDIAGSRWLSHMACQEQGLQTSREGW